MAVISFCCLYFLPANLRSFCETAKKKGKNYGGAATKEVLFVAAAG